MSAVIDEETEVLAPAEQINPQINPQIDPQTDEISEPLVGKWNVLVSRTNWEKGSLILEWRRELMAAGMANSVYSDEAWSRRVGNVSSQHVGRLRRVSEQFGETYRRFDGLFWSHFHAALEWNDADRWLNEAVQSGWSVAQMRVQHWEAAGHPGDLRPGESDVFTAEMDEDVYVRPPHDHVKGHDAEIGAADIVVGFDAAAPATSAAAHEPSKKKESPKKPKQNLSPIGRTEGELLSSLKSVAEFPSDLAAPMEQLKIAILNHKLSGWKDVSAESVSRSLDALRLLTVAEET